MKFLILVISCLFWTTFGLAQNVFDHAYYMYPTIPSGVLEGVAWTNTHMVHLGKHQGSCAGLPQAYGIMGLHDNGKGYFNENGKLVAEISGVSVDAQKMNAESQILAYAGAFSYLYDQQYAVGIPPTEAMAIKRVLHQLSEIPDSGLVNLLARDMQAYAVLAFMNDKSEAIKHQFSVHNYDLAATFGAANYAVLSSPKIEFTPTGIKGQGSTYQDNSLKSSEYGPAIWNPAAACNISSRAGTPISAITIHTIQGTYAGAISWAQNCASSVSYHYVIRSSDGQVTQMVLEADKAWHVGSENPYTIGYEHEGYVNDPSWYTPAMYNSSADLSRDIVGSGYGIPSLRTYYGPATTTVNVLGGCTKIKGHQHYPYQTHTDPGIYWDWEHYYKLINNNPTFTSVTTASGNLYDTGGPSGSYQDDEREFWLIEPLNAASITLNFTAFNIESGYDNLFIYDGDSTDAPLIGSYTGTTSPGIVTSSGGSILIEFRSDCGTVASGWEIAYTSVLNDVVPPVSSIAPITSWQTDDFTVSFTDTDAESGIKERFYLVGEKTLTANDWSGEGNFGFAYESFEDNANNWQAITGAYSINAGTYVFSDTNESNSNVALDVVQIASQAYLYEWDQTITSSASNQRAGMHFFCDSVELSNRGNSYFVYFRESNNTVQIYSVDNNVYTLETSDPVTINMGQNYNCKVYYDPSSGWIHVYLDDSLVSSWQDPTPLTSANAISLRSGGCAVAYDNIHVYQARSATALLTAGLLDHLNIESENAVPSAMVRSLAVDSANNWSAFDQTTFLLDFSAPVVNYINDGSSADIDTTMVSTLYGNWQIEDLHSDIQGYEVAVGTAPLLDDVAAWTSNGLMTTFSHVLASPIYNQIYYVSVRSTNYAGLVDESSTDGQRYVSVVGIDELALASMELVPNPASDWLQVHGAYATIEVNVFDASGKICRSGNLSNGAKLDISGLAAGTYQVLLRAGNAFVVKQLIKR